jgi:hypothetical protein
MCTDIWDAVEGGAGEGLGKKVKEGAYDGGRVAVIDFRTSWGGLLRDFEEVSPIPLFYDSMSTEVG